MWTVYIVTPSLLRCLLNVVFLVKAFIFLISCWTEQVAQVWFFYVFPFLYFVFFSLSVLWHCWLGDIGRVKFGFFNDKDSPLETFGCLSLIWNNLWKIGRLNKNNVIFHLSFHFLVICCCWTLMYCVMPSSQLYQLLFVLVHNSYGFIFLLLFLCTVCTRWILN